MSTLPLESQKKKKKKFNDVVKYSKIKFDDQFFFKMWGSRRKLLFSSSRENIKDPNYYCWVNVGWVGHGGL